MKKYYFLILLFGMISCQQNPPQPLPPTPLPDDNNQNHTIANYTEYWGCWKEAFNSGAYDIILREDTVNYHGFQSATNCIPESSIPEQNIGVFRNDTLILNNGIWEYWCFIVSDTMYYGAYSPIPETPIKFIKN